jgi:hypothetical protein
MVDTRRQAVRYRSSTATPASSVGAHRTYAATIGWSLVEFRGVDAAQYCAGRLAGRRRRSHRCQQLASTTIGRVCVRVRTSAPFVE